MLKYLKDIPRKKKKLLYGFNLLVSDIIFLTLSFSLSYSLRFYTPFLQLAKPTYTINIHYVFYSTLFIILNVIFFGFYKLYNWDYIYKGSGYYFRIFKAVSINIIIIIIVGYLLETFSFSRIWIVLLYIFSLILLFLSRFIIGVITQKLIKILNLSSKTVIIGIGENARRIEGRILYLQI